MNTAAFVKLDGSLDRCAFSNGIKNQANSNFAVILIRKEKYTLITRMASFSHRAGLWLMFTSQPLITVLIFALHQIIAFTLLLHDDENHYRWVIGERLFVFARCLRRLRALSLSDIHMQNMRQWKSHWFNENDLALSGSSSLHSVSV